MIEVGKDWYCGKKLEQKRRKIDIADAIAFTVFGIFTGIVIVAWWCV